MELKRPSETETASERPNVCNEDQARWKYITTPNTIIPLKNIALFFQKKPVLIIYIYTIF
jgi:hypothetical protein